MLLDRLEEQLCDPHRGLIYRALLHDVLGEGAAFLDQSLLARHLTPSGFPQRGEGPTAGRIDSTSEDSVRRSVSRLCPRERKAVASGSREDGRAGHLDLERGRHPADRGAHRDRQVARARVSRRPTRTRNGEAGFLSTHTRNLQDQLEGDLQKLNNEGDQSFRFAVLKGRGNYLCVRSLINLALEASSIEAERMTLPTRYVLACFLGWTAWQARRTRGEPGRVPIWSPSAVPDGPAFGRCGPCRSRPLRCGAL